MEISYYADTDSLFIKLRPGTESTGEEVAAGIVFHYTPDGEVTAIEVDSRASRLVDVTSLKAEGMPTVSVSQAQAG